MSSGSQSVHLLPSYIIHWTLQSKEAGLLERDEGGSVLKLAGGYDDGRFVIQAA